ncbi:hypothetical protein EJ04DRAFT_534600 [Polyplosphaeria fusca]|uniref:Uncharacterized protein n=1 Tax=Polyplosphaeria fusca TaxID=682080 RepID=A0A9P4R192_9PLEO|nr:hypothetical protein EJ04DRAFT_534600 [Polyplosphaeria fusca]
MFELPDSKRVRRNELLSPASTPRSSPDPEVTELLRARAHDELAFTFGDQTIEEVANDEETELVLFASTTDAQPTKIRLPSLDAEGANAGFSVKKPHSYYFADALGGQKKAELEASAIDATTIIELSKEPWPGCRLPWKSRTISASGMKKAVLVGHPQALAVVEEKFHKRTRKGRKTRIALRKKLQASKERQEQATKAAMLKEDTEREKRARKNRERKFKKRERDRAKKLAEKGGPVSVMETATETPSEDDA